MRRLITLTLLTLQLPLCPKVTWSLVSDKLLICCCVIGNATPFNHSPRDRSRAHISSVCRQILSPKHTQTHECCYFLFVEMLALGPLCCLTIMAYSVPEGKISSAGFCSFTYKDALFWDCKTLAMSSALLKAFM